MCGRGRDRNRRRSQTILHRVLTVSKSIRDSRFDLYDQIPAGCARASAKYYAQRKGDEGEESRTNEFPLHTEQERVHCEEPVCTPPTLFIRSQLHCARELHFNRDGPLGENLFTGDSSRAGPELSPYKERDTYGAIPHSSTGERLFGINGKCVVRGEYLRNGEGME